ncbi:GrpB family protein [Microbacterium sp. GXF0217]
MTAPQIVAYDPSWPALADEWMVRVSAAVSSAAGPTTIEHIGSTSVPGLAAKPFLDLQLLVTELPAPSALEAALRGSGFVRALGSRPDSPGVHADVPRPGCSSDRHEKILFYADLTDSSAGVDGVILHVRRADSPFADFVRSFRDWLRSDVAARGEYETIKRELAADYADAPDYDDYTRAKSAFMDRAQSAIGWGA